MARIRTIKPDFWTDEKIVELDPIDRLLFIGLWNFADDQGYMDYSPKRIKMQVFPGDDIDVSRGLASLLEASLIRLYDSVDGVVLFIPSWKKHQRISNPSRARFTGADLQEHGPDSAPLARALEDSAWKGKEGKGEVLLSESSDEPVSDPFDDFWRQYPRKDAKSDARKAWRQITKDVKPQEVLDGLAAYAFPAERQFMPLPASWLRGKRWEDESNQPHLRAVSGLNPRERAAAEGRPYQPWLDY